MGESSSSGQVSGCLDQWWLWFKVDGWAYNSRHPKKSYDFRDFWNKLSTNLNQKLKSWVIRNCWWKKSCTTWDVYCIKSCKWGSTGAGFLPSTVETVIDWWSSLGDWASPNRLNDPLLLEKLSGYLCDFDFGDSSVCGSKSCFFRAIKKVAFLQLTRWLGQVVTVTSMYLSRWLQLVCRWHYFFHPLFQKRCRQKNGWKRSYFFQVGHQTVGTGIIKKYKDRKVAPAANGRRFSFGFWSLPRKEMIFVLLIYYC